MLFLSFVASSLSSCQDEISDASGSWVCIPEPDVSITLTFKSGKAYVNTSPLNLIDSMPSGNSYLFFNSEQFTVRGNKLYTVDVTDLVIPHNPEFLAFVGTLLSPNRMSLHYSQELDNFKLWVKDYTFERK